MEDNLDHFVAASHENSFACPLPLLYVVQLISRSFGGISLCEIERNGLKFLVAVKVALEMLEQDNLLVD